MLDQKVEQSIRDLVHAKHAQFLNHIGQQLQTIISEFARRGRDVSASIPSLKQACELELERRAAIIWQEVQRVLRAHRVTWYPELAEDLKREMRAHLNENAGELTRVLRQYAPPLTNLGPAANSTSVVEHTVSGIYNAEIDLFAATLKHEQSRDPVPPSSTATDSGIWNTSLMNTKKYRFFKYRKCDEFTDKSIGSSTLYGARPDKLNDPFDCQIDLRAALDRAARKSTGERHADLIKVINAKLSPLETWQQHAQEIGVCAFSRIAPDDPDAAPLWSLYADEHRGVCLVYEFTEEYLNDPDNGYLGIDQVKYGDNPITDWLIGGEPPPRDANFLPELLKLYLTVKAKRWSHETEFRILRPHHGEFPVPKNSLVEAYLGLRIPVVDENRIRALISAHTQCKVISKMIHADSDFGITVEKT